MKIPMYQVDAFTDKIFGGNPAAVCLLDTEIPDSVLQSIAAENNLAETAFIVPQGNAFSIRWFTPTVEVDLCGHATLATAHVLFNHRSHPGNEVQFNSPRSGLLIARKNGNLLTLDFPVDSIQRVDPSQELIQALGHSPRETWKGKTDLMAVLGNEDEVLGLKPDFNAVGKLNARGLIVTARGNKSDFVSRFFAPQSGIDEDPVTGSAHTSLIPYWSKQLGKKSLSAIQLSKRKGYLQCVDKGDRVEISGNAITFFEGTVALPT